MTKLDFSDLLPDVSVILERARQYGLENEVATQMIVNLHSANPTEVKDKLWGALEDWDIPPQKTDDDLLEDV